MLLTVALFLTTLGFFLWGLGYVLEYTGIAFIGVTLIIGVGAMVTGTGLEYKSGEVHDQVTTNETQISYEYSKVPLPTQLPLGILVILTGGVLAIRQLNREALE